MFELKQSMCYLLYMTERHSFTYKLADAQQAILAGILARGNYMPVRIEHTTIAAKADNCRIALYRSGKCHIQGKGAADFVTFILEPLVLKSAELGYEEILDPEASQPHMGIDESGKGDFFGPLVAASAYVDESLVQTMRRMDVRDSKTIRSDNKVLDMGRDLRKHLGRNYSIVKIGPGAYNRLYARMRNVNTILAWAHARAIENVLEAVPQCPRAISDQFGSKEQVKRALMKRGREIELVQQPRAESDLAVAAASVIARESYLRSLRQMGKKYEIDFPKGASAAVREIGVKLADEHGLGVLLETAKCHFSTTDVILKELDTNRSALGPEGQVRSKPSRFHRKSEKKR